MLRRARSMGSGTSVAYASQFVKGSWRSPLVDARPNEIHLDVSPRTALSWCEGEGVERASKGDDGGPGSGQVTGGDVGTAVQSGNAARGRDRVEDGADQGDRVGNGLRRERAEYRFVDVDEHGNAAWAEVAELPDRPVGHAGGQGGDLVVALRRGGVVGGELGEGEGPVTCVLKPRASGNAPRVIAHSKA